MTIDYEGIDRAVAAGMAARGSRDMTVADALAENLDGPSEGFVQGEQMYGSLLGIDIDHLSQYGLDFAENVTSAHAVAALHEVYTEASPWEIVQMMVASAFSAAFQAGVQAQITEAANVDG